jgi:hypothetical protein
MPTACRRAEGYLQHLRDLCTRHGAMLIFDEVMTGFRVAPAARRPATASTPDLDLRQGHRRRHAGGRGGGPPRTDGQIAPRARSTRPAR